MVPHKDYNIILQQFENLKVIHSIDNTVKVMNDLFKLVQCLSFNNNNSLELIVFFPKQIRQQHVRQEDI